MNFPDRYSVSVAMHYRQRHGRKGLDAVRFFLKTEAPMENPTPENSDLVKNSVLYKEFLAEREEILKHKWLESEKAGQDIGFEKALLDWIVKYRSSWRDKRQKQTAG